MSSLRPVLRPFVRRMRRWLDPAVVHLPRRACTYIPSPTASTLLAGGSYPPSSGRPRVVHVIGTLGPGGAERDDLDRDFKHRVHRNPRRDQPHQEADQRDDQHERDEIHDASLRWLALPGKRGPTGGTDVGRAAAMFRRRRHVAMFRTLRWRVADRPIRMPRQGRRPFPHPTPVDVRELHTPAITFHNVVIWLRISASVAFVFI